MAYMVPLRYIRISQKRSDNRQSDVAICATRIVAMMSTEIYQARKTISDERKNGTLINGCGLAKAKTAIFLDNGSVVSSPLRVKRLMSLIDKANEGAATRLNKRMKVYDVYDGEPDKDDEDVDDTGSCYDDLEDDTLEDEFDEDDFE